MPIIDHPEHALIGPVRVQRRHLAQSHGVDAAAIPAGRLHLVHGLQHGQADTGAVRPVAGGSGDDTPGELRQHLIAEHNVSPNRMPPAAELPRFHSELHSLTNPVARHDDPQGTPAALAGQAQRMFNLLVSALEDLDGLDHDLTMDMIDTFAHRLLTRFTP